MSKRYCLAVNTLCLLLFPMLAIAQNKDNVEDVKGARWEYEIYDGKELIAKGRFRVDQKVI